MIIRPIIPIPLMIIITIILLVLIVISSKKAKLLVRILIVLFLFLINLRPMILDGDVEVLHSNIDMVFVIDTTLSMDAQDYDGSKRRLEGVSKDIEYIMKKIPGAYYSVITFDNKTTIKLPLTADANAILATVDTLKVPNNYYAKGSNITIFKEELETILNNSRKKEGHSTVVFLFTDGENTSDKKTESLKSLSKLIDEGAVLGYGTTKGGYIQVEKYDGTKEYLEDRSEYPYKKAVSKIDVDNLTKIAEEMGIDYIPMKKSSSIDKKLKDLKNTKSKNDSELEDAYQDLYYCLSPFLIVLFSIELYLDRRSRL